MPLKVDVQPCIPRFAARQMHRNNVPAGTPKEYFKRAFVIPLFDKFIAEMEFNNLSKRSSRLLCLVPSIISKSENLDFSEISEMYKEGLPNIDVLDQEIILWKGLWSAKPFDQRPSTSALTIKECGKTRFPNLFIFLKIGCTLPVTS